MCQPPQLGANAMARAGVPLRCGPKATAEDSSSCATASCTCPGLLYPPSGPCLDPYAFHPAGTVASSSTGQSTWWVESGFQGVAARSQTVVPSRGSRLPAVFRVQPPGISVRHFSHPTITASPLRVQIPRASWSRFVRRIGYVPLLISGWMGTMMPKQVGVERQAGCFEAWWRVYMGKLP